MEETEETKQRIPACPGCHFRCRLDRYQCGRGRGIYEKWEETGEIPPRPAGPPPGFEPSETDRIMFGLNIISNVFQIQREHRADTEILAALHGHCGCSTGRVMEERARLKGRTFGKTITKLEEEGLIERTDLGVYADAFRITEKGLARLPELEASRAAEGEKFLAPLTYEERHEFAALIDKVLAPGREQAKRRAEGEQ